MPIKLWVQGVPMVATSPVRHEPPPSLQLAPIEVHHQCQTDLAAITSVSAVAPPWKALSDFALQTELDQPPFQQLVSSFGESSGDEDDDTVVCLDEPSRGVRRSQISGAMTSQKQLASSISVYHHHQSPPLQQLHHRQSMMYSNNLLATDASC